MKIFGFSLQVSSLRCDEFSIQKQCENGSIKWLTGSTHRPAWAGKMWSVGFLDMSPMNIFLWPFQCLSLIFADKWFNFQVVNPMRLGIKMIWLVSPKEQFLSVNFGWKRQDSFRREVVPLPLMLFWAENSRLIFPFFLFNLFVQLETTSTILQVLNSSCPW